MTRFSIFGLFALATAVANALDCNVGKPTGSDDTPQILEAIEKCAAGGTVNIPAGDYTVCLDHHSNPLACADCTMCLLLIYSLARLSKRKDLRMS